MRVEELSAVDLDALVARALGLNVLGRAWVEDDPDGGMDVAMDQTKGDCPERHVFDPRFQYVYLPNGECACALAAEYPDWHAEPILGGHSHLCLKPVPEYSRRMAPAMALLMTEQMAVWPHKDYWFAQRQKGNEHAPVAAGDTPMQAIARAVVKATFGETIEP